MIIRPNNYLVCGPFPYKRLLTDGEEAFFVDWLREFGGEEAFDAAAAGNLCREARPDAEGFIDLAKIYGEEFKEFWRLDYGVAYAYAELAAEPGTYVGLLGAEDYAAVYINGSPVFTTFIAKKYKKNFHHFISKLKEKNKILIKVGRLAGQWGFSLEFLKRDAPFFVNLDRSVAPEPAEGDDGGFWASLNVLALRDLPKIEVECVEDEYVDKCKSSIKGLLEGERYNIPIYIKLKRPLEGDLYNIKLLISVDLYKEIIEIPIKIKKRNKHRILTYFSKIDGSVQSYGLKTPRGHAERPALLLTLHGFKGHTYFSELYGDKDDLLVVSSGARGEAPYREIGAWELLEILEAVKSRYNVDEDRIYLSGHSMGGYGTWYLGVMMPHLFSAIAPLSSRGYLSELIDNFRKRQGWEGIAQLFERYNPAAYINNLSNTPVFISHGSDDDIVPVEYSRRMYELLRARGLEAVYEEVRGVKHVWGEYKGGSEYGLDCLDRRSIMDFLRTRRRRIPTAIEAVFADHRFNEHWWISAVDFDPPAAAKLEVVNKSLIDIKYLKNIKELLINLDILKKLDIINKENIFIKYNDINININIKNLNKIIIKNQNNMFCINKEENYDICTDGSKIWSQNAGLEGWWPPRKSSNLSGPFMDLFRSPAVIHPCPLKLCYNLALYIQYWFNDYANGNIKIIKEYDEMRRLDKSFNALLIGTPENNKYIDLILQDIKQIKIYKNIIELKNKKFIDKGIIFIYPNPRAERKYAAVLGGTEVALEALYKLDPTIVPDYLAYDPAKFGIVWDGVVDSGFFDSSWS